MIGFGRRRERSVQAAPLFDARSLFVLAVVSLVCFGLLMIYSASSIHAMYEGVKGREATYYFFNQLKFAVVGAVAALALARIDYRVWSRQMVVPLGVVTLVMLLAVYLPVIGSYSKGAFRWVQIGSHTLQPSEFAKVSIVLLAAQLGREYQEGGAEPMWIAKVCWFLALPLVLILIEPDKGSTAVLAITLLIMLWYCGFPTAFVGALVLAGLLVLAFLVLRDGYALNRVKAMIDPEADAANTSYQITQGYLAFGSGGWLGVGLGMSRQKYEYLPEVHTDYIYAVIGEELGLVGTLLVLALFALLVYSGYQIARQASDTEGRLIASGFSSLMAAQLLVNICGVLGLIPASGKPIPFLSYGGSAIIACLMMSGLVVSVARHTEQPASVYERRRSRLQLYDGPSDAGGRCTLRVISGGRYATSPADLRATYDMVESLGGSVTFNANGTRRINLGGNASDRLRGRTQSGSGARRR